MTKDREEPQKRWCVSYHDGKEVRTEPVEAEKCFREPSGELVLSTDGETVACWDAGKWIGYRLVSPHRCSSGAVAPREG